MSVGTLYLIGTPIGNLGDLSPRAVETLRAVDFIAAEDTRVTLKLLNHFEIRKPMICYFEHNRAEMGEKLLSRLLAGESCALVTDAGMPAISDPGEDVVRQCALAGVPVTAVPGPTAMATALALSGLPTQRFCFEGFLSTTTKNRREHLDSLKGERRTMIFYEAPHKLLRTLADLLDAFGDRQLTVCRELTKLHEELLRTTLSEALAHFTETPPRGEFVLVVAGAPEREGPTMTEDEALALVRRYMEQGRSRKEACKLAAEESGFPKRELYDKSLDS
ncbi:MAG: 16S rRNA (cytidine(1402)-2'-O)-methyltransferase [Oscillospiraceae bacterium]|nr:16S rRNA (cytidine(1402)-2'-O)-methyltransferase [Oscillospiraceae bacterium]